MTLSIPSLARAFALLEALSGNPEGCSVTELEKRVAVPVSVISKILMTLQHSGYVARDPNTKRYRLGLSLISLAQRHIAALQCEDHYLPALQKLAANTGELVQLALVTKGHLMVWVAKVDGVRPLRVAPLVGREVVLHATAAGKMWLASLDPSEAVEIALRPGPLRSFTPRTLTTVPALLAELAAVGARGYARAEEELHLGVAAAAAPVLVGTRVQASVSVAFPVTRCTPDLWDEIARPTFEASREIATAWPGSWRSVATVDDMFRPRSLNNHRGERPTTPPSESTNKKGDASAGHEAIE